MYEEILKNVYQIHVPLPGNPLKELNVFLFKGKTEEGEHNLLIDTGFRMKECREALDTSLAELGVSMDETDILLTHLHSDHTGLAPDMATPSTRVFIVPIEEDWLVKDKMEQLAQGEVEMYRQAGMPGNLLSMIYDNHPGYVWAPDATFERYEPMEDGQIFTVGDYELEVIITPGHTPGNLCLWMEKEKVLFSGDHVLFDITPNIQKWINFDNALGAYLESLRKVRDIPAEKVFPSHRMTGVLKPRVDELLAHHTYRLNECYHVIEEEPGLCAFEIAGRMTWRIRARNWEEFPAEQKWFAVGEGLSHLDYLLTEGRIRFEEREGVRYFYPA